VSDTIMDDDDTVNVLAALTEAVTDPARGIDRETMALARAGNRPGVTIELRAAPDGSVLFDLTPLLRGKPYGRPHHGTLPRATALVAILAVLIGRDREAW
jgi:hypothetical protein